MELKKELQITEQKLNIGFLIGGGFGDFLFFANYIFWFCKKYQNPDIIISVFFGNGFGSAKSIFQEGALVSHCFPHLDRVDYEHSYDLFFNLSRYPELRHYDRIRIMEFAPELMEYIYLCMRFMSENPRYFLRGASSDGMSAIYSEFHGQNRLQQPDIYGFLGIPQEYAYPLFIGKNEKETLDRFGLKPGKYITLHRGCDTQYATHVKLWPLEYYGELARLIKAKYPEIAIIQYGVNHRRCPHMSNTDLDIVGKTDMEDVKILLKHALTHIDSDGGMIHLRHALHGGPSIAMYGPNYGNFFGYTENINLTGQGCGHFCDWLTDDWMVRCARGHTIPPCMTSITPEMVFQSFCKLADSNNTNQEKKDEERCGIK